jgi:anti-sigma B factor antagonist
MGGALDPPAHQPWTVPAATGASGMADDLLRCKLGHDGTAETLFVMGELDISSAPALEHAVNEALDGQGEEFRLDLRQLTFMDSTGASTLFHLHKRVDGLGRRLVIVSPTNAVRMVLEILGLDQVIDIHA